MSVVSSTDDKGVVDAGDVAVEVRQIVAEYI